MTTNTEMLRATGNEDLSPSFVIEDMPQAIRRINDMISVLSKYDYPILVSQLREVRIFLEGNPEANCCDCDWAGKEKDLKVCCECPECRPHCPECDSEDIEML